jgi:hypothetical protein
MSQESSGLDWTLAIEKRGSNPLSCSFDGMTYSALGCFPIGLDVSKEDFERVLKSRYFGNFERLLLR